MLNFEHQVKAVSGRSCKNMIFPAPAPGARHLFSIPFMRKSRFFFAYQLIRESKQNFMFVVKQK